MGRILGKLAGLLALASVNSLGPSSPSFANALSMNWSQAIGNYDVQRCLSLSKQGMETLKLKAIVVSRNQVKGEGTQLLAMVACVPNQLTTIKTIMVSGTNAQGVNQLLRALVAATRPAR
ncbi:MAG: hypothetical protein SFW36_10065 [Leptolyngbyaceae cyanobacterium bins.59]|nr:hypothetical protein [Leptolyngbyaceae cyanobacterium bins.59]